MFYELHLAIFGKPEDVFKHECATLPKTHVETELSLCCKGFPTLLELTAGSHRTLRSADGHELHVDRVLNVIGSGYMHKRYFDDMMNVFVHKIFNSEPLSEQPTVVADMGCGDGTLLKTIFDFIKVKTARGKQLDRYPLKMMGVDFSHQSLKETAKVLSTANVVHDTMWGGESIRLLFLTDDMQSIPTPLTRLSGAAHSE